MLKLLKCPVSKLFFFLDATPHMLYVSSCVSVEISHSDLPCYDASSSLKFATKFISVCLANCTGYICPGIFVYPCLITKHLKNSTLGD